MRALGAQEDLANARPRPNDTRAFDLFRNGRHQRVVAWRILAMAIRTTHFKTGLSRQFVTLIQLNRPFHPVLLRRLDAQQFTHGLTHHLPIFRHQRVARDLVLGVDIPCALLGRQVR